MVTPKRDVCCDVALQAESLAPGDRVLLLGLSGEPQACVRKDGAALQTLFGLRICIPMPDNTTRQVHPNDLLLPHIWPELCASYNLLRC